LDFPRLCDQNFLGEVVEKLPWIGPTFEVRVAGLGSQGGSESLLIGTHSRSQRGRASRRPRGRWMRGQPHSFLRSGRTSPLPGSARTGPDP